MGSSGSNEEAQKEFEAALFDVGKKLVQPPSYIDELLIIFEEADKLLPFVPQSPQRSMIVAILPAMQGLITDELLKHPDLDIQVAVASCASEMARITAPDFPYRDDHMRLYCESGMNYERALHILETVAGVKSCLIMLDIEIDLMVVEMFQLFLDTIRPNHSSDMFNHMRTIMILIIQDSDEISVELLRPLLSSVRMDNKNTSPRSWELGKSVLENCAAKLQDYVREAVKAMNLNVDDYAEIVASLCQDTPIGRDTVANEEVEEVASVQVANEEVTTAQFEATDASGNEVASDSSQKKINSVKNVRIFKRGQSKQSKVKRKGSVKRKKTTKSITPQKHESADVVEKVVESLTSMPAKAECPGDLDPEKEKRPMDFRLEYGPELVNLRIRICWPLDQTYYTGTVESFDPVTKKHKIKYDDDEEEVLDMSEERWELFGERQPQQAQSSRKREADPSPSIEPGKTQKKATKRKAGSSKKVHAGSSSKRSKSDGCSIVKSGHSTVESIPVTSESDDESCEASFSWKAKAMTRAGKKWLNTSRRKGNPSHGTPDGAKNG